MNTTAVNGAITRVVWPEPNFQQIEAIAEAEGRLVDLWEASPVRIESNEPKTDAIIDALFPDNSLLCCGWNRYHFNTRPRSRWYKLHDLEFIVPSPMSAKLGLTREGKLSTHTQSNVGPRRFLVVEFDFEAGRSATETGLFTKLDVVDVSAGLLLHLASWAPLALAVYSGGKSLHGWFYGNGQSEETLMGFMQYAVSLGADPMTWAPVQFVRMPDGRRHNGKWQSVFFFNPGVVK